MQITIILKTILLSKINFLGVQLSIGRLLKEGFQIGSSLSGLGLRLGFDDESPKIKPCARILKLIKLVWPIVKICLRDKTGHLCEG